MQVMRDMRFMKKMRNRFIALIAAIVMCLAFSSCSMQTALQNSDVVVYTMYIGLNDKDTYTQLLSYEEAEKKVSDIALKYVNGFTVLNAKGAYKDEKGVITYENTLVFQFSSTTEQQIKSIMDETLIELNQNAILIEKEKVNYEFYEGAKP